MFIVRKTGNRFVIVQLISLSKIILSCYLKYGIYKNVE